MKYIFCMIVCLALTPIGQARADILYDNGLGAANVNVLYASDYDLASNGTQSFLADDFSLPNNSILTGVSWTGGYGISSNTPTAFDSFEIAFYNDSGGIPDDLPFLSFNVDSNRVDTGLTLDLGTGINYSLYQYNADFAFPVIWNDPGTFWVSIRNRTFGETNAWGWGSSDLGGFATFQLDGGPWQTFAFETDFQLLGTAAIPEPSSAICLGMLAMGAAGIRRRRAAA